MALYTPDHTMDEAKKYIDSLEGDPNSILINYYIDKKQSEIDKLKEQLHEYREWFNKLDRFLPNKNIIY